MVRRVYISCLCSGQYTSLSCDILDLGMCLILWNACMKLKVNSGGLQTRVDLRVGRVEEDAFGWLAAVSCSESTLLVSVLLNIGVGISWSLSGSSSKVMLTERLWTASTWWRTTQPSLSLTWYEIGPRTWIILPGNHFLVFKKSFTWTLSSTWNARSLACASWCLFWIGREEERKGWREKVGDRGKDDGEWKDCSYIENLLLKLGNLQLTLSMPVVSSVNTI